MILKRTDITGKIGELNIKIAKANRELEELEVKYKKKKLEIRKYKNESAGLQLELQELELENHNKRQKQNKIVKIQKGIMKKYDDPNNDYYSQDKDKEYYNSESLYKSYIEKNVVPYND